MTKEYVFDVWAPPGAPWSDWCKPVLFAHLGETEILTGGTDALAGNLWWSEPADGSTAIVIDTAGSTSVWMAIQLAQIGYRPVPLYNAIPSPMIGVACDLAPIVAALIGATPLLDHLNLPHAAPPVFMLDAARRIGMGGTLAPGMFDNRSVSLPTDFPSANLLLSRGIRKAILLQADRLAPQEDLAHTLLRWQQAGIMIEAVQLLPPQGPVAIQVPRPPLFKTLWQRLAAVIGLRRHPAGGFGAILPIPSSSGG